MAQTMSPEQTLVLHCEKGQPAPSASLCRVGSGAGSGSHRYSGDVGSERGMAPACSHFISVPHRKALEMSCCIESSLAKIVAEFEIALEHNVLQPLNKLSEVVLTALLAPLSNLTTPSCVPRPPPLTLALSPPGGAPHHPEAQEDPPEVDF